MSLTRSRDLFALTGFLVGLALDAIPVVAGVNVWTSNGPAATRIDTVAIDPRAPGTLYAGAGDGTSDSGGGDAGVFKSTDGGVTWSSLPGPLDWVLVDALAIDPSNPARLYAGTFSWDFASGVFKSADGRALDGKPP